MINELITLDRLSPKDLVEISRGPLRPRRSTEELLRELDRTGIPATRRLAARIQLQDNSTPGYEKQLASSVMDSSNLPLTNNTIELCNFGGEADVYLYEGKNGEKVAIKILKGSVNASPDRLKEIALETRAEYEWVKQTYAAFPELVINEEYLILHGPVMAMPAVAIVQPVISKYKDLFLDFTPKQLLEIAAQDLNFRDQLHYFAAQTVKTYKEERKVIDISLGKNNVVVFGENSESPRIAIVDPHSIHTSHFIHNLYPRAKIKVVQILQERLNLLSELSRDLSQL